MKFYCDKCQTKYSIADDKVRGKVLKVRCKNCSHVITVREPVSPAHADSTATLSSGAMSRGGESREPRRENASEGAGALAGAAAAARTRARLSSVSNASVSKESVTARPSASASVSWHYAVNGESFGPFTFEYLHAQFASAKLTDAAYVWNETFEAWKPVGEVAEFAGALVSAKLVRPSRATVGVSGALKAINVEDYKVDRAAAADNGPGAASELLSETTVDVKNDPGFRFGGKSRGSVADLLGEETLKDPAPGAKEFPTLVESRSPGFEPVEQAAAAAPSVLLDERETLKSSDSLAIAEQDRRSESAADRLQRLRDRLKGDESPLFTTTKSAESTISDVGSQDTLPALEERTLDLVPAVEESAAQSEVTLKDPMFSPEPETAQGHDGLFSFVDETTQQDDAASLDTEAGGFFASEGSTGENSDYDAEAIPFLTTAPKLSGSHGYDRPAEEAYSGSLLIELDKFKKERKSKFVKMGAAAVALFLVAGGIVAWISSIESVPETNQVAVQKEEPRELVFRRYSKEEQGRIRNLIEIPDEVVADSAEVELAGTAKGKGSGASARAVIEPKVVKNTPTIAAPAAAKTAATVDPFEAAMQGASSHNPLDTRSGVQRNDGAVAVGMKAAPSRAGSVDAPDDDKFKALAALQMPGGEAPIYQPSDALKNRGKRGATESGGLSDAQASAGFQFVRQSIGLCRERTMQRGLKLDTQKIYVTLEIQPTGKVSSYTVEPPSVRGTEFDRCMASHTSRWKFASYSGETTLIKAPFILQ